jgi:hypothetical protein
MYMRYIQRINIWLNFGCFLALKKPGTVSIAPIAAAQAITVFQYDQVSPMLSQQFGLKDIE